MLAEVRFVWSMLSSWKKKNIFAGLLTSGMGKVVPLLSFFLKIGLRRQGKSTIRLGSKPLVPPDIKAAHLALNWEFAWGLMSFNWNEFMPIVLHFFTFSFILAFHYISFYFFPAKRKYFGQRIFYILLFIFFPSLPFPFPSLFFLSFSFLFFFFCFCVSCFVFIQKMLGYRSVSIFALYFSAKKTMTPWEAGHGWLRLRKRIRIFRQELSLMWWSSSFYWGAARPLLWK